MTTLDPETKTGVNALSHARHHPSIPSNLEDSNCQVHERFLRFLTGSM